VDYFQYKTLAKNFMILPHIPRLKVNLWYGNYFAVKKLSKEISLFKDCLEHGVNFCDRPGLIEVGYIKPNKCRNIYTYSDYRKHIFMMHDNRLKVVSVGPYILGADFFHTIQVRQDIKKRYGKMLLVFPTHSLAGVQPQYDRKSFIDEIIRIRPNFQSVFVCLHYLDITNRKYRDFLDNGFMIVTAGKRDDIKFLNRLKDLIYLSDMTMSNSIGTHIGYSICMSRPHYLHYQQMNYSISEKLIKPLKENLSYEISKKQEISSEFVRLFGYFSWDISTNQINICRKYWGGEGFKLVPSYVE
jgi:hypothetical protein